MTADEVVEFYSAVEGLGLRVWVDGGWGVDALLGRQTREHRDLDIAVELKDVPGIIGYLAGKGYREVDRENEWNYVMTDDAGHRIDFHVFIFDEDEKVVGGLMYPTDSLTGRGKIGQTPVACITAEYQVESHAGYKLTEKDYRDVAALCARFNLEIPEEFVRFRARN